MTKRKSLSLLFALLFVLSGCKQTHDANLRPEVDYHDDVSQQLGLEHDNQKTSHTSDIEVESEPVMASSMYYANSLESIVDNDLISDIVVVRFLTPGEYSVIETTETIYQEGVVPTPFTSCGAETNVVVEEVLKGTNVSVEEIIRIGETLTAEKDGTYHSKYLSRKDVSRAILFTHYFQFDHSFVCPVPDYHIVMIDEEGRIKRDTNQLIYTFEDYQSVYTEEDLKTKVIQYVQDGTNSSRPWVQSPHEASQETLDYFLKVLNQDDVIPILRSMLAGYHPDPDLLLLDAAGLDYSIAENDALAFYRKQIDSNAASAICIRNAELDDYMKIHTFTTVEYLPFREESKWVYYEKDDVWIGPDEDCAAFVVEEVTYALVDEPWNADEGRFYEDRWTVHNLDYKYSYGNEHGEGNCSLMISGNVVKVISNHRSGK